MKISIYNLNRCLNTTIDNKIDIGTDLDLMHFFIIDENRRFTIKILSKIYI